MKNLKNRTKRIAWDIKDIIRHEVDNGCWLSINHYVKMKVIGKIHLVKTEVRWRIYEESQNEYFEQ